MKKLSLVRFWQLCWFSKPACDRLLYKLIARHKPRTIVHCGIGSVRQTVQMIQVAQRAIDDANVKYIGIDLFDARPKTVESITLKEVHRALSATGAKTRLIPGEIAQNLARMANQMLGTELLVIATDEPRAALDGCWFFVPRMLTEQATVLLQCERSKGTQYELLSRVDVEKLALEHGKSSPKAA